MLQEAKSIIEDVLVQHGFKLNAGANPYVLASKEYPCLNITKEALVWFTPGDEYSRTISGEYWSEGKNVISGVSILADYSADQVRVAAERFIELAEKSIHGSYGYRLRDTQDSEPALTE